MKFNVKLTEEVIDYIESLPIKVQAKIHRTIDLLKDFGYSLTEPHSKKLKSIDHLKELRIIFGNDIYRLFYFHWKDKIYVITSGYTKKSDKTDPKEIEKAIRIMNDIRDDG